MRIMKFILWGRVLVYGIVLVIAVRGISLIQEHRKLEAEKKAKPPVQDARSACVLNQKRTQETTRFLQANLKSKAGDPIPWDMIYGEKALVRTRPSCPVDGPDAYSFTATFPEPGNQVMTCKNPGHQPDDTKNW